MRATSSITKMNKDRIALSIVTDNMRAAATTRQAGSWKDKDHGFHGFLLVGCAFVKAAKPSERIEGDHTGRSLLIERTMKKIKTYNIMLSKRFPATHPKKGEPTFFRDKVLAAVFKDSTQWQKLHTIRENYPLWLERIKQVEAGEAVISLRQWTGAPYRSKTTEITRLTAEDGVGIQKLNFGWHNGIQIPVIEGWYMFGENGSKTELARNDGLSIKDWMDWFKTHEDDTVYSNPMAIIHFTKFRY